jgi:hypothetical protein
MHDHGPPARESAVDLTKFPEPQPIEGIGHSHIAITTKSAAAQQWFDQGLALLHCFWDYEALRAFEQSVRLDRDCAMCHWGLSRALGFQAGTEDQVKQELAKAKELAAKTSDHEQRYIRAYLDSQDKKGDEAGHEFDTKMEALIDRYPDDIEAKLQLALHSNGGYDNEGDPRSGALYAQTLLKNILHDHPIMRPQTTTGFTPWKGAATRNGLWKALRNSASLRRDRATWFTCQGTFSIGSEITSGLGRSSWHRCTSIRIIWRSSTS